MAEDKLRRQEYYRKFYTDLNDMRIEMGLPPKKYHLDLLEDEVFSRTIFVKIHNQTYSISYEELNQVFSRFGILDDVVIFSHGHGFHSKICFSSKESMIRAFELLNSRNIYDDCCTLELFLVQENFDAQMKAVVGQTGTELQDRRNDKEIVVDALKVEDFVDELEKADFGQIVKEHQNCVVSLQESTAQQIEEEPENVPKSTEHILGTLAILLRDCSHVPPPKLFGDGGHDNLHQLGFLHEKQFPAPTPLKVLPISSLEIMECQNYFEEMSKTELDEKVAISIDKIELNLVKPEMNPVESLDFGGAHKVLDIMPTTNIVLLGSCFHLMKSNAHELFEKMPEKNLIDADETVTLLNALGDFYASIDSCSSFVFDPGKGFAFPLHIESAIDDFIKVLNTLGDAFGSVQSRSFPFDPGKHFELSSHTTSCAVCCGFFIKIVLQTGAG